MCLCVCETACLSFGLTCGSEIRVCCARVCYYWPVVKDGLSYCVRVCLLEEASRLTSGFTTLSGVSLLSVEPVTY